MDDSSYPVESEHSELENVISDFNNMFGHLNDGAWELINAKTEAERKRYSVGEHIRLVKEAIQKMLDAREYRRNHILSEYKRAIDSTMPRDYIERMKVSAIMKKHFDKSKFKRLYKKYGAWINGWNEDAGAPNIILATHFLPLEIVQRQRHNLTGIPKEYYTQR